VCKREPRFWFKAEHKQGGRMCHVISARSIGRARVSMGLLSESYIFSQLRWCELSELIGCMIPSVDANTVFADGHLLSAWHGRTVSIEIAD